MGKAFTNICEKDFKVFDLSDLQIASTSSLPLSLSEIRRQSVDLFHLSWESVHCVTQIFHSVHDQNYLPKVCFQSDGSGFLEETRQNTYISNGQRKDGAFSFQKDFYSLNPDVLQYLQVFEMNERGFGISKKDRLPLKYFQSHISVIVKTQFVRQVQLFLIPQKLVCKLNDIQKWTQPTNYIILSLLLYQGERSSGKNEIKRFLCYRFRAVFLWNDLANLSTMALERFSFPLGTQFHFSYREKA